MQDPAKADRNPALVAHWVGGSRSRVEFKDKVVHIGGDDELNPMQMFLATLAACDVDLVAMHASFLGLKIESLSVEATGHFNVQSYLGLDRRARVWIRCDCLHCASFCSGRNTRADCSLARTM